MVRLHYSYTNDQYEYYINDNFKCKSYSTFLMQSLKIYLSSAIGS